MFRFLFESISRVDISRHYIHIYIYIYIYIYMYICIYNDKRVIFRYYQFMISCRIIALDDWD